jgi:hypothetical protein
MTLINPLNSGHQFHLLLNKELAKTIFKTSSSSVFSSHELSKIQIAGPGAMQECAADLPLI